MNRTIWQIAGRVTGGMALLLVLGWGNLGCKTGTERGQFSPVPSDLYPIGSTNATVAPAPAGPVTAPSGIITGDETGRLAVEDLVRVTFSGVEPPIQPHEERIKEDGNITLPLVGAIKALGQSTGELQKAITEAYVPMFYKRLTVTVTTDRRVYYVGGQVRVPGRQEYLGPTTVTKAIQSAGDFNDFAAKTRVELTRADGKFIVVNCAKAARNPKLDLSVFPGDKIHVPLRDWRDLW
jgi:protein involved in polysaccharide export with SLBB domain